MSLIKIISISPENIKQDKNGKAFSTIEVFYTVDGKARQKKVMTFTKEIYATCKNAKAGDEFTLVQKKNGEYWDWVSLTPATGAASESNEGAGTPTSAATSGYSSAGSYSRESNEERAKRQVMIVRQNSLTNAVAFYNVKGQSDITPDDIVEVAKEFEAYVLNFEVPTYYEDVE